MTLNSFAMWIDSGYYYEGFLAIQRAVDLSIMSELGGRSASQGVDVQLKSFPYPPYYHDRFIIVMQLQMPFFIMLCFIVTAPVMQRRRSREGKETQGRPIGM